MKRRDLSMKIARCDATGKKYNAFVIISEV